MERIKPDDYNVILKYFVELADISQVWKKNGHEASYHGGILNDGHYSKLEVMRLDEWAGFYDALVHGRKKNGSGDSKGYDDFFLEGLSQREDIASKIRG